MSDQNSWRVIRLAKSFFYGTFLSRIFGMIRDMILAFYFGSSEQIAGFMIAYRFANLFRRLFGETTLQAGFIPYFQSLKEEKKEAAYQFYRDLLFSLALVIVVVVLLLEIILGIVQVNILVDISLKRILTLTMIMLPSMLFVCLYALNASFLQCHRYYFLPAFAPAVFNVFWIISIFLVQILSPSMQTIGLSVGIFFAFFSQWALTHHSSTLRLSLHFPKEKWRRPNLFSIQVKKLYRPLILGIIGVGAVQINSALDAIFARLADPSGPAYLWYAIRLQQLPFALFSIAISSALLPPLSRAIKMNNIRLFQKHLSVAVRYSFALMFSCSFAIIVLGSSAIDLIYGRGNFSQTASIQTFYCLISYGVGLVPQTFVLIFANCFYAHKIYTTAAKASVVTVVINVCLNAFFVFVLKMKAPSVALATSLSALFNYLYLHVALRKKFPHHINFTLISFLKTNICVLSSSILTLFLGYVLFQDPTFFLLIGEKSIVYARSLSEQLLRFSTMFFLFFLSLFLGAKISKNRDLLDIIKKNPF